MRVRIKFGGHNYAMSRRPYQERTGWSWSFFTSTFLEWCEPGCLDRYPQYRWNHAESELSKPRPR